MSTSKTYQQSLVDAGYENRPPMLERGPYEFKNFVLEGSTIPRLQTVEDLEGDDLLLHDTEMEVMNMILLSIPNEIYNFVDACTSAKDMWKRVERLTRGTIQNKVDRETRFTNEFDQFVAEPGEALVAVYNLDSFDDPFYYLQQFEKLVNASRAKKLEKSHDSLALVAQTGSSSRQTSSYYVTHPTSVVDTMSQYSTTDQLSDDWAKSISGKFEKDTHVPDLCAVEKLTRNAYQEAEKQQIFAQQLEKLENEKVSLDFKVKSLIKERDNVKIEYKKLFDSIKKTRSQTQKEMDELIVHVSEKTYAYGVIRAENQDLLSIISELKTRLENVEKGSVPASNKGDAPTKPPQIITTNTLSNIKLPVLQKDDYDTWAMKMEHYLEYIDNEVWKVIQNGNSKKRVTKGKDGVYRVLPPTTQEEQFADEKERKARTLLLMAVPKDHLRRFHDMDDAKEIWAAIKTRFGGNAKHFARECKFKGLKEGSRQEASRGQDFKPVRTEKEALMTIDEGQINWVEQTADEELNHALMAFTVNNEVSMCSKLCLDSYNALQAKYDELQSEFGDQEAALTAHKLGIKKLESQLRASHKQQTSLTEKLNFQANQIFEKDEKLKKYRRIGMKAVKDKNDLQKIYGELELMSDASIHLKHTYQSNDSDGELGTVSDHSVNDASTNDHIPIPSIEQNWKSKNGKELRTETINEKKMSRHALLKSKSNGFMLNSGSVHVNSGTQFKFGASRFNTGHGNVNSGNVYVNSGTPIKSGSSRFNTGKLNVNSGSVHVNSARVTRPVSNQTSYKTSPKLSQVDQQEDFENSIGDLVTFRGRIGYIAGIIRSSDFVELEV
ncbi:hypothetical protein Tco_1165273 [Tanacetum coccineum]